MCKRSVLVHKNKLPGLFTILLIITLSFITNPGVSSPRFIYEPSVKLPDNIVENELCDSNQTQSDKVLALGRFLALRLKKRFKNLSNLKLSVAAGGIIVDLTDEQAEFISSNNSDLIVDNLDSEPSDFSDSNFKSSVPSRNDPNLYLWNYLISGVTSLKKGYDASGAGTSIGIIALNHPYAHKSLKDRVKQQKVFGNFADEEADDEAEVEIDEKTLEDLYLLHPLGILGGNQPDVFTGIAQKTEIILARISLKTNKTLSLLDSIEWMLSLAKPPDAVLICTDFQGASAPAAVRRALAACRNAGIIPIIPAGNNPSTITGIAALPGCVTVGAVDRWKQRALFSGTGPAYVDGNKVYKPDCVQPGLAVLGPSNQKDYSFGSGTLQAAAHFAGLFLLMKEILPQDTDSELIVSALLNNCEDLGDPGMDKEYGRGIPLPLMAISSILYPPEE